MKARWFSTLLIVMMLTVSVVPAASAAAPQSSSGLDLLIGSDTDDAPHPLGKMQRADQLAAFQAKMLEDNLNTCLLGITFKVPQQGGQEAQIVQHGGS